MVRPAALTLLIVISLSLPQAAAGKTARQQAGELFKQGNQHFLESDYTTALAKFRRAYRLYPSFKLDYNIAATLEELGKLREAASYYHRFLVLGRDKSPKALVSKAYARLRQLRQKLASLRITCDVDGAQVYVDGKKKGKTPLKLRVFLKPGRHTVRVRADGKSEFQRSVTLSAGHHRHFETTLTSAGNSTPVAAATGQNVNSVETSGPGQLDNGDEVRRSKTVWGYAALGVGAASALTAVILYGVGGSQGEEAYDNYQNAKGDDEIARYHGEVENARTKLIAGHVLMGVAATAFGVSIYHFLTRPAEEQRDSKSTSAGLVPLQGGAAFSLSGRF